MRAGRTAVAAVGAAVALGLTAAPVGAAITWGGSFDCNSNPVAGAGNVSTTVPQYQFEQSQTALWWIPQYFVWTDAGWQHYGWGGYAYNTQGGAPHAWVDYSTGQTTSSQDKAVNQGWFYAVRNWVHAEGQWHNAWAVNADQQSGPKPESTYWCKA